MQNIRYRQNKEQKTTVIIWNSILLVECRLILECILECRLMIECRTVDYRYNVDVEHYNIECRMQTNFRIWRKVYQRLNIENLFQNNEKVYRKATDYWQNLKQQTSVRMQNILLPLDFRIVDYWDNIDQANGTNGRMQNSSLLVYYRTVYY